VANHPARDNPHLRPCSHPHRLHRPLSTALRSRRLPLLPVRRTHGDCGEAVGGRREAGGGGGRPQR
jgi:hypothetical protein